MYLSRKFVSIANLACLFLIVVIGQAQPSPHGITPEDYFSFEFISDPNVSRDGKLVAMSSRKSITAAELELIDGAQIKTRMYHA